MSIQSVSDLWTIFEGVSTYLSKYEEASDSSCCNTTWQLALLQNNVRVYDCRN